MTKLILKINRNPKNIYERANQNSNLKQITITQTRAQNYTRLLNKQEKMKRKFQLYLGFLAILLTLKYL